MRKEPIDFGPFTLDFQERELRHHGDRVALRPTPLRLMLYLAANRHRTVPREELLEEVWPDSHVDEGALNQALRLARNSVGDGGRSQSVIRTVRGAGYRFIAEVDEDGSGESGPLDRYVGHGELTASLEDHLAAALAGRGRLVVLEAEAGLGKSRTAGELARSAARAGALVAFGSVSAHSGEPPLWAWIQVFRSLAEARPVRPLRDQLEVFAPGLLEPGADMESVGSEPDDTARFRILDAADRCLWRASELGPVCIVLEDVHDFDELSLELLELLGTQIGTRRMLILATRRPASAGPALRTASILGRIARQPRTQTFTLPGLGARDAAELVGLHATRPLPPALVELLVERAGGNPFYLIELARFFSRGEGAAGDRNDWECRIPHGVRGLLGHRLAALTDEALGVLHVAAALGPCFDPAMVGAAAEEADPRAALAEALSLGLLVREHGGRRDHCFEHELVRDAVYADLASDPARLRACHLRIADALEADDPGRLSEIAHHLQAAAPAGDMARTVGALQRAGDRARSLYAEDEAIEAYERALQLIDRHGPDDDRLRCVLLTSLGEVAIRGTRFDEGRGLLQRAASIARVRGWRDLLSHAALAHAFRSDMVGVVEPGVIALLEEALEGCPPDDEESRALLHSALAVFVRYHVGGEQRGLALSDRAVELARRVRRPRLLARVLEDASIVRFSVEDPESWYELNREIVQVASEAGDTDLRFRGTKGVATACLEMGDRGEAERAMASCERIAAQAPTPYMRSVVAGFRAMVALLDGDFAEAERRIPMVASTGVPGGVLLAAAQLYVHRLETGRIAELESSIRSHAAGPSGVRGWHFALARLLAALGRPAAEVEDAILAAGPLDDLPRDRTWLPSLAVLAEALAEAGLVAHVRPLYRRLRPYERVHAVHGNGGLYYGNVGHFLGLLATVEGRFDAAERHLAAAAGAHERVGARTWQARTRLARAELYLRRGDPGDGDRALASAQECRAECAALGMTFLANAAERIIRASRGAAGPRERAQRPESRGGRVLGGAGADQRRPAGPEPPGSLPRARAPR